VLLFKGIDLMSRAGLLAVSYPLAVGVCIVSFSIYSAISLKENFDTRDILATILGIAGIAALAA
jgi:multidrug transporter EmrE-like cation transporter